MTDLVKYRVQLPHGSDPTRGPGWTDLLVREGTSDEDVVHECFVLDVYHLRGTLLRPTPPEPFNDSHESQFRPRVIDLGACTGIFSALVLQMFPHADVTAVEPNSENVALAKRNTAKFGRCVVVRDAFETCPSSALTWVDRIAMEWHGSEMAPWAPPIRDSYGELLHKLAYTHAVTVFGHPDRGGMLYAHRYDR